MDGYDTRGSRAGRVGRGGAIPLLYLRVLLFVSRGVNARRRRGLPGPAPVAMGRHAVVVMARLLLVDSGQRTSAGHQRPRDLSFYAGYGPVVVLRIRRAGGSLTVSIGLPSSAAREQRPLRCTASRSSKAGGAGGPYPRHLPHRPIYSSERTGLSAAGFSEPAPILSKSVGIVAMRALVSPTTLVQIFAPLRQRAHLPGAWQRMGVHQLSRDQTELERGRSDSGRHHHHHRRRHHHHRHRHRPAPVPAPGTPSRCRRAVSCLPAASTAALASAGRFAETFRRPSSAWYQLPSSVTALGPSLACSCSR